MSQRFTSALPNDKIKDWFQIGKHFAFGKINVTEEMKLVLGIVEKFGKSGNFWLPVFSPFLTKFSKDFFHRVGKDWDSVVKG